MVLKRWLNALQQEIRTKVVQRRAGRGRHGLHRHAPAQAELLEDRTLLTPFVVNTLDDAVVNDEFVSLREAIMAANGETVPGVLSGMDDDDSITFDPSLDGGTIVLTSALPIITDDLAIDGGGTITISGNGQFRIFNIDTSTGVGSDTDVSLSNLSLEFGNVTGNGGAIFISDGEDVTLDGMNILGSTATGLGGAIFAGDGTLTITNSQIGNEIVESDVWSVAVDETTNQQKVFAFVDDQNSTAGLGTVLNVFNNDGTVAAEPLNPVVGVDVDEDGSVFFEVQGFLDEVTPYEIYTSVVNADTPVSETEDNDTSATADPITEDTLIAGTIADVDDDDFFSIMLGANDDTLVVMLDNDPNDTGLAETTIDILNADGSVVLSSSLFAGQEFDAAIASGLTGGATYLVRITGMTGDYEFVAKAVDSTGDLVAETEPNDNITAADALTATQFGQGNLSLTGGNQATSGGGIYVDGGTLNLDFTSVNNNVATGFSATQGGGGIYSLGGTVTIDNSSTVDFNSTNVGNGSGGGILAHGGLLTIIDSSVSNNSAAANGGGLEIQSELAAVTVEITNSNLSNNSARFQGGGVNVTDVAGGNTSTFTVRGGVVAGNVAGREGGGLWNDAGGTMIIRGVDILSNTANGISAGLGGGGIFNNGGTVMIQNNITEATLISGNVANGSGTGGNGGGILNNGGILQVQGAVIDSNFAVRAGGGIEANANNRDSDVTLRFVTVSNNTAGVNGGGIHVSDAAGDTLSDVAIIGGQLAGNSADGGGGVWNGAGGTLAISGATISDNTASGMGGGGIFNDGGMVRIDDSLAPGSGLTIITNNIANGSAATGGGILSDGGNLQIEDALINFNSASGAGGGIQIATGTGSATVTVSETVISFNTAGINGGGVHITDAAGGNTVTFDITESEVSFNTAGQEGGGLWNAEGATMNIDGLAIFNNTASGNDSTQGGGGIFNDGGTVNITSTAETTLISGNIAGGTAGSGGGILNNGGTLTLTGVVIEGNAAVRAGGGIEATTAGLRASTVIINNSTINSNTAGSGPGNGGAIHITDMAGGEASTVTITLTTISGNSAAAEGGGLWNDVGGTMTIRGSNILTNTASGNDATQGGGGVFNNGGIVTIESNNNTATTIAGNIADGTAGSGGGILNDGGTLNITGALIASNSAVRAGGGIEATTANGRDSNITIASAEIVNNLVGSSPGNGGGVHISDGLGGNVSTFSITGSTVSGNSAAAEGGGLWNDAGGTMTITETTISGNTASGTAVGDGGGGIFNNGGTLNIESSTVSANSAANEGGGIRNAGTLDAVQITVSGNAAGTEGGGIFAGGADTVDVLNSTITANTAGGIGGGIANGGLSDIFLESTIVAGNEQIGSTPSDISGAVLGASQFNLIGIDTGLTGIADGTNNNIVGTGTPIDPLLGPLADNGGATFTHALLPGSPAVNAGSNPDDLDFDQRGEGFARTIGPQTDIGAVETQLSLIVVGTGPGDNRVRIFDASSGDLIATITPYGAFAGAIRTAVADVNGDGILDVITGAGPGGGPHVKVFSGADNFVTELFSFFAFDPAFTGGVFVAAANFNPLEDSNADIVVSADAGGGPHVRVFNGTDLSPRQSFFPYALGFTGGVRVATGDITGDGIPDIITAAGPGGGPHVRVFDGATSQFTTTPLDISQTMMHPLGSFFAYAPNFTGGVFVASGDVDGSGRDDIITGPGTGGGPHVRVFGGEDGTVLTEFFAFDPNFTGGVTVGVTQGPGDGIDDIIVGAGPGGGPHVRVFRVTPGGTAVVIQEFFAFEGSFTGGIFVSGGSAAPSPELATLLFAGGDMAGDAGQLTQAELDAFVEAAADRQAVGAAALAEVDVRVSELPAGVLGLALPGTILIDADASGAGWFIDPSPEDNSEFDANLNAVDAAALGRVDLLTVLLHELGHQFGAEDLGVLEHPENVMAETLTTGKRRLPNEDLDALFANQDLFDSIL